MSTLIPYNHVVDPYDKLVHDFLNPEIRKNTLFTFIGLIYSSYDAKRIAYSLDYYLKKEQKQYLVFSDYKECPMASSLLLVDEIVNILVKEYNHDPDKMFYMSGSLDKEENKTKLLEIYEKHNFIKLRILNYNYWEKEWSLNISEDNLKLNTNKRPNNFLYLLGSVRPHRLIFLSKLIKSELIRKTKYSIWYDKERISLQFEYMKYHPHLDDETINSYKNIIINSSINIPNILSIPVNDTVLMHKVNDTDESLFTETNISIIPETNYYKNTNTKDKENFWNPHLDFTFLTEKTYRAMAYGHAFIILSRPNTLKTLRGMGFKTFHPYIDEEYDMIEDDDLRMDKIISVMKNLNKMSSEQWLEFHEKVSPIIIHNHTHLRNSIHAMTDLHTFTR